MTPIISGDELLITACQLLTAIASSDPNTSKDAANDFVINHHASIKAAAQSVPDTPQTSLQLIQNNQALSAENARLNAKLTHLMAQLSGITNGNAVLDGFARLPISHDTLTLVTDELAHQKEKWGDGHIEAQTTAGHALILQKLVDQVALSWVNCGEGRDSVGANLVKLAATALVAIEKECHPTPFQAG